MKTRKRYTSEDKRELVRKFDESDGSRGVLSQLARDIGAPVSTVYVWVKGKKDRPAYGTTQKQVTTKVVESDLGKIDGPGITIHSKASVKFTNGNEAEINVNGTEVEIESLTNKYPFTELMTALSSVAVLIREDSISTSRVIADVGIRRYKHKRRHLHERVYRSATIRWNGTKYPPAASVRAWKLNEFSLIGRAAWEVRPFIQSKSFVTRGEAENHLMKALSISKARATYVLSDMIHNFGCVVVVNNSIGRRAVS